MNTGEGGKGFHRNLNLRRQRWFPQKPEFRGRTKQELYRSILDDMGRVPPPEERQTIILWSVVGGIRGVGRGDGLIADSVSLRQKSQWG